jgi:hypothetical protein
MRRTARRVPLLVAADSSPAARQHGPGRGGFETPHRTAHQSVSRVRRDGSGRGGFETRPCSRGDAIRQSQAADAVPGWGAAGSGVLGGAVALGLLLALGTGLAASLPARAADEPVPKLTVDEDCSSFAFTPSSDRIVYSVRRLISTKHLVLQRDDIGDVTLGGRKRRIVNGEKLVRSPVPFSYSIQAIRIAPDGAHMTIEMLTSAMVDEKGTTREGELTDLMNTEGKEIKIRGEDSVIDGAYQAVWLADGQTVVYLREAVKPRMLFRIDWVRPDAGRGGTFFDGQAFSAVAWDPRHETAVAIERNENLTGPIRLDLLDLKKDTVRELALLDGFLGRLSVSPSGTKVAYFSDGETLEIRKIARPDKVTRIHIAYGKYQWTPDERRLLLKRGPVDHSGQLFWVSLPDGKFTPALAGLIYSDFAISPDGRWLAVTEPAKRVLKVFPMEP